MFRAVVLLVLILFCYPVSSQQRGRIDRQLREAQSAYGVRDYDRAISLAKRALASAPGNLDLLLLMAEIKNELHMPAEELEYLQRAALHPDMPPLVNYRLAQAYFKVARYSDALLEIEKYLHGNPAKALIGRALHLKSHAMFAAEAINSPVGFLPESLGDLVNSEFDEYWPSLTVDGKTLIFTRLVPGEGQQGVLTENFYVSNYDDGRWSEAIPLEDINTAYNEGAQTLSADGNLLFFTRCNHPEGFGSCDIWFSRRIDGIWTTPRNAGRPLNTPGWEGQPSLSAFGDVLYFSSNRQGGKGNKDIWRIGLKGWRPDGMPMWGEPVNLGDSINTPGDEISPFIHPNGRDLFFSSDYWPGFGGLDLFRSRKYLDGTWGKPQNLGYPINTTGNEQGLVIDRTGSVAFMASGRDDINGMDLFTFELDEQLRPDPVTYIQGTVINSESGQPVPAMVNMNGLELGQPVEISLQASENGSFLIALPSGAEFAFHVNHPGFLFYSEYIMVEPAGANHQPVYRTIELTPVLVGNQTNLYNIFFHTGEFEILQQSYPELNTLASFLQQNKTLEVEIQGHTDSTGSDSLNAELSENRARAVVDFLITAGVQSDRLTYRGYGASQPVATNETEEGRALNRRTTVEVTSVF